MEETTLKVRQTIAKTLSIDLEKVTDSSALVDDLGADSLDMAELGMALQEEFSVELSDEQLAGIRTVADVCGAVRSGAKSA